MISYHLEKNPSWAYAKDFKQADTNDVSRLKRAITGFVWSPCVWRDGVRRQENFLRADWCVLDFDDGEMTLEEARNTFCDCIHLIGTTKSHGKEKGGTVCDRFRVAIRFEHSILNLRDYRYTMSRMVRRYPVDRTPKDGARFFFPCTEIVQASAEGYTESPLKAPEGFERPNYERAALYQRTGTLPPKVRWALTNVVPVGERNTTWYWVAKELARCGVEAEDIIVLIVRSATYAGQVRSDLVREIESCVRNGVKAAEEERNTDERRAEDTKGYQDH